MTEAATHGGMAGLLSLAQRLDDHSSIFDRDEREREAVDLRSAATAIRALAQASLPRKLTAENGAKAALIGEFYEEFTFLDEDGEEQTAKMTIKWDTIKRIWDAAVKHFDRTSTQSAGERQT